MKGNNMLEKYIAIKKKNKHLKKEAKKELLKQVVKDIDEALDKGKSFTTTNRYEKVKIYKKLKMNIGFDIYGETTIYFTKRGIKKAEKLAKKLGGIY